MAAKKKTPEYISHAAVTEISATSRCAVKVNDNFYTIEASETRAIVDEAGVDMDKEWSFLFDELNTVVDNQCQEIINTFKK